MGFSQEKLAEAVNLSSQTINDIEGCRMWVSDKTISKLAAVFNLEAYQLLIPAAQSQNLENSQLGSEKLLLDLETSIVGNIHREFESIKDTIRQKKP